MPFTKRGKCHDIRSMVRNTANSKALSPDAENFHPQRRARSGSTLGAPLMFTKEETIAAVQRKAAEYHAWSRIYFERREYSQCAIFQRHAQYEYKYARMLMGV